MIAPPPQRRTVLYPEHVALGARMAPFAGFEMPIQYSGVLPEHAATRSHVTVFDTCHMGELAIEGPAACRDLEALLSCRVDSLPPGRCRYGLMCNSSGGVLDDLIVYRDDDNCFFLVVNAGTRERDAAWIHAHLSAGTELRDVSDTTAKLDVQGPQSARLMVDLFGPGLRDLTYFSFLRTGTDYGPARISRTGYTGELGYEIYVPAEHGVRLWRAILAHGAVPAGLGARDTLRLEMGMPLYGHELSENRNAAESGFTWAIAEAKSFAGSEHVHRGGNAPQRLVGIRMAGRRTARANDALMAPGGTRTVGVVTSGSFAPSLGVAVGLAYVDVDRTATGTELIVKTTRQDLPGRITDLPFYRQGSARMNLAAGI